MVVRAVRWAAVRTAAVAVVFLVTGCIKLPPELDGIEITRVPDNSVYEVTYEPGALTVTSTTEGGNMRIAVWPKDQAPSGDQIACASFRAASQGVNQAGIALRIRREADRNRAVTVTKNVWGPYDAFNVHVWDTSEADLPSPKKQFTLPSMTGQPLPWRMCARTVGTVVQFAVWPFTGDDPGEPNWNDSTRGGSFDLGADMPGPGVAGWYAGHLAEGNRVHYDGLVSRAGST